MPDQIALKLLRQSDLTLFDPIWQRDNDWLRRGMIDRVSKQKAINLNAREFLDKLYPGVREAAQAGLTRIPLSVTIYGPNGAGAHEIARKAVRSPGSKNWRLNGETIHEPEGEAGRYSRLAEGDLALLRFDGEPQPAAVVMALLAAATGEDEIIRALMPHMDDTGMVLIGPDELAAALDAVGVSREHPVWRLADDADAEAAVERAMEGDTTALEEVRRRRRRAGGGVSLEQLLRARAAAEATGRAGEEMVADWLGQECDDLDWVADAEPLSPFDMLAEGGPLGPGLTYLDVKTTKAGFATRFHISMGEAAFAAEADRPYRIVRVFGADGDAPRARISEPINEWARDLLKAGDGAFPEGVRADGFVVDPEADGLAWGAAVALGGVAAA
jgi:hypothetical protein